MLIQSINIKGLLSFKDASLEMRPLNVLIGPNASGKSNFLEIMALLRALPRDLPEFFRRSGGVADWWWKGAGERSGTGTLRVAIDGSNDPASMLPLQYLLDVGEQNHQVAVIRERLEYVQHNSRINPFEYLVNLENGWGHIVGASERVSEQSGQKIETDAISFGQSVFRERRDPTNYRELSYVGERLDAIRLYRESNIGRKTEVRTPQATDEPTDFLNESFSNLALVLNSLFLGPSAGQIEDLMRRFYDSFERAHVNIQLGTAQLVIRERGLNTSIPATRLSDGTLRFLALLTILCHPEPPPLICIEEPELGLHPDIIPVVAELLRSASERTQLVVTTHSKRLIDEFSDDPESVVVCERDPEEGTQFQRLSKDRLDVWLERYELGELWEKGEIGGNRW